MLPFFLKQEFCRSIVNNFNFSENRYLMDSIAGYKDASHLKDHALQRLRCHFESLVDVNDDDWDELKPSFSIVEVDSKYCLQAAGKHVDNHYFIVSGLVRMYYVTQEGKEVNKSFYDESNIVGNLSALILNQTSRFFLETLEPAVLVKIDVRDHQQKINTSTLWNRVFNQSCQRMLIRNERREAELLTMTSAERFRQFLSNFPDGLERIPQYHIASYLGVTPVALSRYKKTWLADQ